MLPYLYIWRVVLQPDFRTRSASDPIFVSTLPGTGGIELAPAEAESAVRTSRLLIAALVLTSGPGGDTLWILGRERRSDWAGWSFKMGLTLLAARCIQHYCMGLALLYQSAGC